MKADLLFTAAFDRVAATQATHEYLWDKANEYAQAFDGTESDPRFPIYMRLFCLQFRPGFNAKPEAMLAETNAASIQAIEHLERCSGETPERLEKDAQAEAEAEAQRLDSIAERKAYALKKAAEAEADARYEANADALLQPATLEAVLVVDLPIHGLAKNAFKKANIETVGEILTYQEAKPLPEISGLSETFAAQTNKAIDDLRAQFAKSDTDEAPVE